MVSRGCFLQWRWPRISSQPTSSATTKSTSRSRVTPALLRLHGNCYLGRTTQCCLKATLLPATLFPEQVHCTCVSCSSSVRCRTHASTCQTTHGRTTTRSSAWCTVTRQSGMITRTCVRTASSCSTLSRCTKTWKQHPMVQLSWSMHLPTTRLVST